MQKIVKMHVMQTKIVIIWYKTQRKIKAITFNNTGRTIRGSAFVLNSQEERG